MAAAFEAGCVDYLRDPWSLAELRARAGRLCILRFRAAGKELALEGARLSTGREEDTRTVALSDNERKLLRLLLLNQGEAVTRKAIALELWGEAGRSDRTPDVYAARVRTKIGRLVPGGGVVLKSCRGLGYRLDT
jgi:DNA-binding response OmpR family regulator